MLRAVQVVTACEVGAGEQAEHVHVHKAKSLVEASVGHSIKPVNMRPE